MSPRPEIRSHLRQQRRALSAEARLRGARQVTRQLAASPLFRAARRIAFYWPSDGEIDVLTALQYAWACGKTCYLPVLWRRNRLGFAACREGGELTLTRFGIPEPVVPARRLISASALDLVLLPLVGFDVQGYRLGMGAGFYDRTLARRGRSFRWRRPRLVGVAYDFQRVPRIVPAPWDVALDAIVTPTQWYIPR